MVTFDKGARVARLTPGTQLDARQVGILLAQVDGTKRTVRLTAWDDTQDPGATQRITALLEQKGPQAKAVLLIALSMGVLRAFDVTDQTDGTTVSLSGSRGKGYTISEPRQANA